MCCFIKARDLQISHIDDPARWRWYSDDPSGIETVELLEVWWLEIVGRKEIIDLQLRKNTTYAVYLIYKLIYNFRGLKEATGYVEPKRTADYRGDKVFLEMPAESEEEGRLPIYLADGWIEIKLGEFFNNEENSGRRLKAKLLETNSTRPKSGLIIKGREIRPDQRTSDSVIDARGTDWSFFHLTDRVICLNKISPNKHLAN